jgi:hypothetical protein
MLQTILGNGIYIVIAKGIGYPNVNLTGDYERRKKHYQLLSGTRAAKIRGNIWFHKTGVMAVSVSTLTDIRLGLVAEALVSEAGRDLRKGPCRVPKTVCVCNEFLATLLSREQRKSLNRLNQSLTSKVLCTYTPSLQNSAALAPTNQLLYGNVQVIAAALSLELQGLDPKRIFALEKKEQEGVMFPWYLNYDSVRQANNKRMQYFPWIIAFPSTSHDVSKWIALGRKYSITPSIRSGGHSYEGWSAVNPLVIDLSNLELSHHRSKMRLHKSTGVLEVCPGVRLGCLYTWLAKFKRIIPGGICPSVCIGGLTVGGGIGMFVRKWGFTCDNLLSADVALANGAVVTVDSVQNADLFRAIKGGGNGSFGVVTRYAIQTQVVPLVVQFTYVFNLSDFAAVVNQFQTLVVTAPAEMGSFIVNAVSGVPVFAINGLFIADNVAAWNAVVQPGFLQPLAILLVAPIASRVLVSSYLEFEKDLALESLLPPFYKMKSRYMFQPGMTSLELDSLAALLSVPPSPDLTSSQFVLQMAALGPGNNNVPLNASVLTARGTSMAYLHLAVLWNSPADAIQTQNINYINNFYNTISAFPCMQFADPNVSDSDLGPNYMTIIYNTAAPFLQAVKNKYDPTNFFQFPQSVPL